MRKLMLSLVLAGFAAAAGTSIAKADSLKFVEHPANWTFNDEVYWNELAINSPVNNGTTIHSTTSHNAISISFGNGGPGQMFTQCTSPTCTSGQNWVGDFLPGQHLLGSVSSSGTTEGPLTLTFGTPISGIGFSIESNQFGTFTAEMELFDGSTPLGTFFRGGDSEFTGGSMQTFLAVLDLTSPDITSVEISTFNCGGHGGACTGGFAIGALELETSGSTTTPEPASLALLGSGILALGLLRRKLAGQH